MNLVMMWWLSTGLLVLLWWAVAWRSGPRVALGVVTLMATLVASWSKLVVVGGMDFFVRDAAILACLASYCVHPKSTYPWKLCWLDGIALVWLFLHGISDGLNDGWSWIHFGRAYVEWGVPYIAARLAFQDREEVKQLIPWGASVGMVLGLDAMVESLFSIHPWEWLYGYRPDENMARDIQRWGLYRPWGPTSHPIYFGFVQLILMPWAGLVSLQALRRERSPWWIAAFPLSMLGIFFSLSRGPMAGALVVLAVVVFIRYRVTRIPLALAFALGLVLAVWQSDRVLELADRTGAVSNGAKRGQRIEIEGQTMEFSGSRSRFVIFSLYRRAMQVAGWTGYGTSRTSVFPPRVPMGTDDRITWQRVRFVDNCYVLMTLRFGWMGGILFASMAGLATFQWFLRAWQTPTANLEGWMAGVVLASVLVMGTVWLAHDYKFLAFWLIGTASSPVARQLARKRKKDRR